MPTSLIVKAPPNHNSLKDYNLQRISNGNNRRLSLNCTELSKQGRRRKRKEKEKKKPQTTIFEEKGEPKRIRTEVPLLTSLTPPYLYNFATLKSLNTWRCSYSNGPVRESGLSSLLVGSHSIQNFTARFV